MTRLFAFLRGVNIGKRTMTKQDLCQSFARAGFPGAETFLASGNVVFDGEKSPQTVTRLENQIETDFVFKAEIMLRSLKDLRAMVQSDPFGGRKPDTDIKFYVFMLGDPLGKSLPHPHGVAGDFEVTRLDDYEIYAIAYRLPNGRFGPGLDMIAKPFGRYITNRNWNTVLRLIDREEKTT